MKSFLVISLVIIFYSFIQTKAQGEAALPFLYVNPSPELTGLGWTGVSIPNDDPFGFYYNPAMLGNFARTNNLAYQIYSTPTDWQVWDGLEYNSYALNIGYNFKNQLNGLNLSTGAGFIHNRFSYGTFYNMGNNYESYDYYNAFGFGVNLDCYVLFSAGISFKSIYSKLNENPITGQVSEVDANAIDYGFLLTLPLMKLFNVNNFELSPHTKIIPKLDYSIGYSRLNIGDEIYYVDPAQSDPLPLTARFGHTFSFGFDLETDDIYLNLITYDLILEADDILIDRTYNTVTQSSEISYQGLFGDIDFGKNLIQLEGSEKVVVHKGHAISLGETVKILIGSFSGRGFSDIRKSDGIVVSSKGLLKMLGSITKNKSLRYIGDHFEIRWIKSTLYKDHPFESDFSSVSISVMNYSFN